MLLLQEGRREELWQGVKSRSRHHAESTIPKSYGTGAQHKKILQAFKHNQDNSYTSHKTESLPTLSYACRASSNLSWARRNLA